MEFLKIDIKVFCIVTIESAYYFCCECCITS